MSTVGVLALQGGYHAHARMLEGLGHRTRLVRDGQALVDLDGLVLPGGESSTHLKLIDRFGLQAPLDRFIETGRPVLVTCAGLILAAREVSHPSQRSFGWLDISVRRNGWGRQLDSFEAVADGQENPLIFIRAPRIESVGPEVEVLLTFEGEPIMVRQGHVTGAAFHPELTRDPGLHRDVFGAGH
jgi:5'-phosphate synthase pdxT subunit